MSSETMSSSLPSSVSNINRPKLAMEPLNAQCEAGKYRQTVYDMSAGSCIVECRRRHTAVPASTPPSPSFQDFILYDQTSAQSKFATTATSFSREATVIVPPRRSNRLHVTDAKMSSLRKSGTATTATKKKLVRPAVVVAQHRSGLEPPPTPRPGRLPTPDFPDVDGDWSFCNCCIQKPIGELCASCKTQVVR